MACSSRRRRCCAGTASSCDGDGPTRARGQGDRRSTPRRASSCCGSRVRTRAGAISGSPASSRSSASPSRRARFAGCSRAPALDRLHGEADPPGASSSAARQRASSPATSSRLRLPSCAATTCCSSSSSRADASTSPASAPTRTAAGSPSRRATSASAARSHERRFLIHDRDAKFSRGLRRGLPHRRRQGDPDAVPGAARQRLRRALRADRPGGVPGLAADPRASSPRARPARLRRPLQPPSARTARWPPVRRIPPRTLTTADNRSRQATRSPRRRAPRVLPGRRMTEPTFWHPSGRGGTS